jgi:Uma2 family endonuclease
MYDLPSENPEEPGVPDQFHPWQADLLTQTFLPPDYPSEQMMIASDLNLYYDVHNTRYYKRPDWYVALGAPHLYEKREPRLSYVMWQEGVTPYMAIELLSPGTSKEDLGMTLRKSDRPPTKWEVYEQILGIPYYIVFDRYTDELRAFELHGRKYRKLDLRENVLQFSEVKLSLRLWEGIYQGLQREWLRWYDEDGNRIPTLAERSQKEKQRAEKEKQRAEREKRQKEIAEKKLRKERELTQKLLAQLKASGIVTDAEESA